MSLVNYKFPCVQVLHYVEAKDGLRIAICNTNNEAVELCSILNAHFAEKEHLKGVCDKCAMHHHGSKIGMICYKPGCGGTVVQSIPFTVDAQPQPNREETDAVAVKHYESGRKLEVQAFVVDAWADQTEPAFSYGFAWRIKPTKRRVVVGIFKNLSGQLYSAMLGDGTLYPAALATAECEVEA